MAHLYYRDPGTGKMKRARTVVAIIGDAAQPDPRDRYRRVEYIEPSVDGSYPYVITDVCAENNIGLEIVAAFPRLEDRIPMGSRQDSGNTRFYVAYPLSASSIYYGFNAGTSISCALQTNTVYRLQTNFLNSRLVNVYDADGTRKGGGSISGTLTPHTVPIAIFGYNSASSGEVSSRRGYRLYRARISRGYDVIRDYVPSYRTDDGVIGLYEKITGQFLVNADGDSAFAKGAEIEW